MARFDRSIAVAQRLIKKNGEAVKWRVTTAPVDDPDKPWLKGEPTVVDHDAIICFLPVTQRMHEMLIYVKGSEIIGGYTLGYMGAVKDFVPSPTDQVIRDGVAYAIEYIDKLAPNGQQVLYTIEFKS